MAEPEVRARISADATGVVQATNQASESVRRFGRTVAASNRDVSGAAEATRKLGEMQEKLAGQVRNVGLALAAAGATMTATLAGLGKITLDFQTSMRNTNSIAKEMEGTFRKTFETVAKLGPKLGTNQGPRQLAEALYDINSSGFSGQEGLNVLAAAAKAASAGMTDAKTAAGVITQSLNAYGASSAQAGQFADIMFRTVEKGVITFEQLASSIGQVNASAKGTGVSFEEVNAGIAVLTQRGSSAGSAVTGLRNLIQQLSAPTKEAQELLDAYGISAGEAAIRSKGLAGVVADLYKRTGGNKVALRRILGDQESADAAAKLVGPDQGALFQQRIGEAGSASGAADSALAEQRKALMFQLQEIWAAVQGFAILGLQGLESVVVPVVDVVRRFALALLDLPQGMKTGIAAAAVLASGLATVGGAALAAAPFVLSLVSSIKLAGSLTAVLAPVISAVTGFGSAFAAAALPVTAAVVAIVAAGAALKTAWDRNWGGIQETTKTVVAAVRHFLEDGFFRAKEAVTAAWDATWSALRTGWTAFMVWLKPIVMEVAGFLGEVWALVRDDYSAALAFLVPAAKGTFGVLWNTIVPALSAIKEFFGVTWSAVSEIVKVAWELIKGFIVTAIGVIRDQIRFWFALLSGDWQGAWNALTEGVQNFGKNVTNAVGSILDTISQAWSDFIDNAFMAGQRIMEAFTAGLKGREAAVEAASNEIAENTFREATGDKFLDRAGAAIQQAATNQQKVDAVQSLLDASREHSNLGTLNAASVTVRRLLAEENAKAKDQQDQGFMRQLGQLIQSIEKLRVEINADVKAKRDASAAASKPGEPWVAPPDVPDVGGSRQKRQRKLSQAEMLQYVRQHADLEAGLNLASMTPRALEATYKLVQNAAAENIRLILSSAVRGPRYPGDKSHHVAGEALDFVIPGISDGSMRALEITKRIAAGTGWVGVINEYLPHVRQLTGGSGAHMHASMGVEPVGGMGTEGVNWIRVPGGRGRSGGGNPLEQAIRLLQSYQKAYQEYVVGPETEFQRRRREEEQKFQEVMAKARQTYAPEAELTKIRQAHERNLKIIQEDEQRSNEIRTLQAQAQHQEFIGWHTAAERTRIRLESAQQVAALEEEARLRPELAEEASRKILEIRQAEIQKIADLEVRSQAEQAQRILDFTEGRKAHRGDKPFEAELEWIRGDIAIGRATDSDLLRFFQTQLNAWQGTDAKLREAQAQFVQFYRDYLQQQLQLQGQYNLESLQLHLQQLTEMQQQGIAVEMEIAATRQLIREQEMQQQQERLQVINQISDTFQSFLVQTLSGQQSFSQTFQNLWRSLANTVISEIAKMIVKTVAFQTVLLGLRRLLGGIFGGIFHDGGLVGEASPAFLGPMPGVVTAHTGGLISAAGKLLSFHSGGVVGPRLRPDEVLAKLQKGEIVLSRQNVRDLGAAGPGGGGPVFHLSFPGAVVREEMDLQRIANHVMEAMFRSQRSFLQGAY